MNRKNRKKHFLSKREKAGSIAFLIICYLYTFYQHAQLIIPEREYSILSNEDHLRKFEQFKRQWDSMSNNAKTNIKKARYSRKELTLKPFDPNAVSQSELIEMGIPKNIATALVNYRVSGGRYTSKESLKKVYGLTEEWWIKINAFISIQEPKESLIKEKSTFKDLNEIGYYDLMEVLPSSQKLANRILNYRKLLGGFIFWNQLSEVYGITDSLLEVLKDNFNLSERFSPKKISINHASFKRMLRHPYISLPLTKTIDAYRKQHGPFESIEALKNIHLFTDSIYVKLVPYLTIHDTVRNTSKQHPEHSGFSNQGDSI